MEGFLEKVVSKPRLEGKRVGVTHGEHRRVFKTEKATLTKVPNQSPLAFR